MSASLNISVLLLSCSFTFRYSQDLMAKKNVLIASWHIALCVSVACKWAISQMTQQGRAFCCFSAGCLFLKDL
jgi:hypothetical protein